MHMWPLDAVNDKFLVRRSGTPSGPVEAYLTCMGAPASANRSRYQEEVLLMKYEVLEAGLVLWRVSSAEKTADSARPRFQLPGALTP